MPARWSRLPLAANSGRRGGAAGGTNTLRIIGGRWRSRQLQFPDQQGLRPTSDRVRETLFNWLQPVVGGARCLDLFAGSGALGLEALSRGASSALFVDSSRPVCDGLRANLRLLAAEGGEVVAGRALDFLAGPPTPYDIVFLDPPFRQQLLGPALERLATGWLAPGARVYIEYERELGEPTLPAGWELLRSKQAGQVRYLLATVRG